MGTLYFNRALKLNPKYKYTLSITADQTFVTYAGVNGCINAKDFVYFESSIVRPITNNGTNTLMG